MKNLIILIMAVILSQSHAADSPNFVFFIGDDISQEDFGCYGHPTIKTPNVDSLAANGMRFDNAYLTISSCTPSRNSIITGRYPHNTGAPELHSKITKEQICFTELLQEKGYYTVLSGKNHLKKKYHAFDKISTGGGGPGRCKDWVELVQNRPKDLQNLMKVVGYDLIVIIEVSMVMKWLLQKLKSQRYLLR